MNAQTKQLKKLGRCTHNVGAPNKDQPVVFDVVHGNRAFMTPDKAKKWLKDNEVRSWKTFGKHPASKEKDGRGRK